MADTFSPLLRAILQANGGNINLWGTIFNASVIDLLEEAITGVSTVDVTFGNVDLTPQNGLTDDARPMFLYVTGNPGATAIVTVPTLSKMYIVINATNPAQSIQVKTTLSAAITIRSTQSPCMIFVDSANNRVRHIGRANGVLPMSAYTTTAVTIKNRTAGTTGFNVKYAKQGHFVTLYIPSHTVTTSDGNWNFNEALPASIAPENGVDLHNFYPTFGNGVAAGAKPTFYVNPAGALGSQWGFANVGTAAFGAGPFTLSTNLTVVYSTRS
jgi:hypothetical protein